MKRAVVAVILALAAARARAALAAAVADEAPAGARAASGGSTYPPNTTLKRIAQPPLPRPTYLSPTREREFSTEVTRIADQRAFGQPGAPALRHIYAKNQPFNADETLIMLDFTYPAPILDGRTYRFLRTIHQPSRAVWSNLDPNRTIGTFAGTNKLVAADMRIENRFTVLHRFREYRRIDLGLGEGNLSLDDRYAALFGVRPDGGIDLFVYDLVAGAVVARRDLGAATIDGAHPTVNNATMSPSGAHVVIQYNGRGLGAARGIVAYDRGLTRPPPLSPNGGGHYDVCATASGGEVIVTQAADSAALVSVSLADGREVELLPAALMDYPIHVSCRNTRRPGWAYVSEFAGTPPQTRSANYQSVLAVALDGSGLVERFAHEHRSAATAYSHEAQAVPNRAGDRVVFASDWERRGGPVYDYVARAD